MMGTVIPSNGSEDATGRLVLYLTIRFTTSDPDLRLEVPRPNLVTVIALKQLIRAKLSPPTNKSRLRLIYSGKVLTDTSLLTTALKISPPPLDLKGKGKLVDHFPPSLVFINCSIGDLLSADELSAEAAAAASSTLSSSSTPSNDSNGYSAPPPPPLQTTMPAPRGFDRLLSSGFSQAEVNQLRMQFLSLQSAMHTPDTMPSQAMLRSMEDAWLDDNDAGRGASSEQEVDAVSNALDDLLWGLSIGFLWPLGAMAWLSREDGVWSQRRQTAVWSGFVLCVGFGIMNLLS